MMNTGVSKMYACLYDECQCMNETNTINNEISIICMVQNTTRPLDTLHLRTSQPSLNIKTFQFYNYNLKSLPENLFANLSIEYLVLDLKEIELLKETSFSSIKLLTRLIIYHLNKFEQNFLANDIAKNLTSLSIELSGLTSLDNIGKDVRTCHNLKQLILSHNRLTSFASSKILAEMKSIETLKLNNNQIDTISFDIETESLKHLILSSNSISFIDEKTFKNVKNLILLDLFENKIKSIEPTTLLHVKNLLYLYLGNNYLMKLPNINSLSRLKQLDMRNQHGFLMSLSNDTFKFKIKTKNQISVYLDEYFIKQNLAHDWYLNANRPMELETTSFDLTLKTLESLFRTYLRKVERLNGEPSDNNNRNYIIYRLFSHQTTSIFDINYFANNYRIDYDFKVEKRNASIQDKLDCIITDFKGVAVNKTRLSCISKPSKDLTVSPVKSHGLKKVSLRNVSKFSKLKIEHLNFVPKSSSENLNFHKIFIAICILGIFV
jgi:Leucine-rich repeat (LRR) protein